MLKRKTFRIKDIARESGASLTTVSLVLNRRDHRISEATRRRVLEVVEKLGYRPSRLAQGLQSQRTGILGILLPRLQHAFADVYFGELISAAHDHASSVGYKVLLEVAHPEYIQQKKHLELFDRDYVDGLLCMGVSNKDAFVADFADGERPMVVVNNFIAESRLNSVRCDYFDAGRQAGQHLVQLGHRTIALIHGAPEVQTSVEFRRGLQEALRDAGQKLPASRMIDGMYVEEGGANGAVELLRRDPKITAIVAGNDKMAIGAISGLKQSGLDVPGRVSVIGCDGISQGAFTDPPLTTVNTPIYDVGKFACQQLFELIEGRAESVDSVFPVSLTVRKSVAPPRG